MQTTSDRVLDVSKIEIDKSAACADDTGYVGEYIDSSVFFHNSFNHIAAVICRRNIGFQEGNIALFFISDAFFSVFPCFLERCCYKKATALAMSVLFAVSMAGCGSSASTAKKVEVTSVEDLADLKIGVQTGTTGDSQASDAVNADSQMQRYNKGADAIQALKNGKIDCVVIDSLPAEKFVAANDDLKIVEGIFDTEEYAMCFKKGNELRDEFNTALAELKEDGTLDEIMSNYIGDEVGQHPYESPADVDRSNGTLTMATNAEFEPWEYKEGTDIVGIDADISQAICDKLGYELKIEDMAFETILASVNSGKADFGAAGMTVTPAREESVDFTDTYANATQVVIVRK